MNHPNVDCNNFFFGSLHILHDFTVDHDEYIVQVLITDCELLPRIAAAATEFVCEGGEDDTDHEDREGGNNHKKCAKKLTWS